MATITKSATAPSGDISLSAGQTTFTLNTETTSYETDDQTLISAALGSTQFDVVIPPLPVEEGTIAPDPNDPRLNRSADHLSAQASPQSIAAAEANQAAIEHVAEAQQNISDTTEPTVAEALADQFVATGTDVGPVVPFTPSTITPTPAVTSATEPVIDTTTASAVTSATEPVIDTTKTEPTTTSASEPTTTTGATS